MAFLAKKDRLPGRAHPSYRNRIWRLGGFYVCLATCSSLFLLCSISWISPADAADGGWKKFTRGVSDAVRRATGRTSPSSSPRGSSQDLRLSPGEPDGSERPVSVGSAEEVGVGGRHSQYNYEQGKEALQRPIDLYRQAMKVEGNDPKNCAELARQKGFMLSSTGADGEGTFLLLERIMYIGTNGDSVRYLVSMDGEEYLLRFLCVPTPDEPVKESSEDGNTSKSFFAAPLAQELRKKDTLESELFAKREPAISVRKAMTPGVAEVLTGAGVALPITWGPVAGVPDIFKAEASTCSKFAVVYPPMYAPMKGILAATFDKSSKLYMSLRCIELVARAHILKVLMPNLTIKWFWLGRDAAVYLNVPDGEACVSSESRAGCSSSKSDSSDEDKESQGRPSSLSRAASQRGGRAPPRSPAAAPRGYRVAAADGGVGGGPSAQEKKSKGSRSFRVGSIKFRKKSAHEPAEEKHNSPEFVDGCRLAGVLFEIWCGDPLANPSAYPAASGLPGLEETKDFSFRNCTPPPPSEIKKIIRGLCSRKTGDTLLPRDVLESPPYIQLKQASGSLAV